MKKFLSTINVIPASAAELQGLCQAKNSIRIPIIHHILWTIRAEIFHTLPIIDVKGKPYMNSYLY